MKQAEGGIAELRNKVDSLVIIPNERLKLASDTKITMQNAFEIADDVLQQAVQSISDLIKNTGFINLDFADVSAVMKDAGRAHGRGPRRRQGQGGGGRQDGHFQPPLETSINGARGVLINVTGSIGHRAGGSGDRCQPGAGGRRPNALIIFGAATFDESLEDEICVTVIATGFDEKIMNAKSTDNAAPSGGRASGRNADEGGKGPTRMTPTRRSSRSSTGSGKPSALDPRSCTAAAIGSGLFLVFERERASSMGYRTSSSTGRMTVCTPCRMA